MRCEVDPDQVSAAQPDDNKDIKQVKADCRSNEKIHAGDIGAWLRRKVRHPGDGGPDRLTVYFATLE
jgi:hypothetical protein